MNADMNFLRIQSLLSSHRLNLNMDYIRQTIKTSYILQNICFCHMKNIAINAAHTIFYSFLVVSYACNISKVRRHKQVIDYTKASRKTLTNRHGEYKYVCQNRTQQVCKQPTAAVASTKNHFKNIHSLACGTHKHKQLLHKYAP